MAGFDSLPPPPADFSPPVSLAGDLPRDWYRIHRTAITTIRWKRRLKLVDFAGPGLVSLGLDNRINDGDCYPLAQQWSYWIWSHPDRFDGILYVPRNAPHTRSAVIFEGQFLLPPS